MSLGDSSTELGKVRGLGSAREGGEHWIGERVSSIALLLLGVWLIASLLFLPALDHATVSEWLRTPLGAVPMALFVITSFYHGLDGLKVMDVVVDHDLQAVEAVIEAGDHKQGHRDGAQRCAEPLADGRMVERRQE